MASADPRAEERVGSVLHDKWTLERLLGVGGMGAVYAARHRNGARAAVKILSPSSGRHPHVRSRFLREGYAANRVEHAGAVKVLDDDVIQDGPDEGTAYLVMELLDGESLHERAKRDPPLSERDLLEIADSVLMVLDAAHSNGVVHRDLKPDNLFLARDPEREGTRIKVLDFGLARLLETSEQTIAGMAVGTPTYMSPEQAAGHVEEIDGRTDIYALGSILFQLASHQRIHDAAHTLGLVVRMATMPAPKLQSVAPDVDPAFARVVDRALEFKREDRYPTAAAMRADVRAALASLGPSPSADPALYAGTAQVGGASVSSPDASVPSTGGAAPEPPAAALADTVQMPAIARARSASEPRPVAGERSVEGPAEKPARGAGRMLLLALAVVVVVIGWQNRFAIARVLTTEAPVPSASSSPASSTATSTSVPSSLPSAVAFDASMAVVDAALPEDDASALAVSPVDAGIDEGADAGDDEEEEDDDDLDAGLPNDGAAPASSNDAGQRRSAHPAAKPTQKKRAPRRPGQPPRRKKRRHW